MRTLPAALAALALACNQAARPGETTPAAPPAAEPAPPPAPTDDDPEAPPLDGAAAWIGVDAPIDIKSLRGQVVILDFWTYCCINCMHVLPLLRDIEQEFAGQPLTVIGVHSAKFDAERDPRRIREAMRRYGVEHPVAVDSEMTLWNRYGASGWPTLVVIKPNGRVAGVAGGEPDGNLLRAAIRGIMADARADGSLSTTPQPAKKPVLADSQGPLAYPGKVIALPDGGLAVSDSGHHRVLVLDRAGKLRHSIGSGLRGWIDGSFAAAALDDPQGLAITPDGAALYIADTRNHAVRKANLKTATIETIAGTGALGEAPLDGDLKPARETALRSPWDLALTPDNKRLIIALAGSHQIAALDLDTAKIRRLAGSGRETITDGDAERSAFAQPSGLSLLGGALYVADSEVSGVRAVAVSDGLTRTIAGDGLFDFGDRDGPLDKALFQHPLHVLAVDKGAALLVADTYNNKIKRIDLKAGTASTFYTGDGELALHEPAGITRERSGALVVADTNADRLLRISADGKTATPVALTGVPAPLVGTASAPTVAATNTPVDARVALEGEPLRPGVVKLDLQFVAPDGHEFSEGSPFDLEVTIPPTIRARTSFHGTADGGPIFKLGARLDLGADDDGHKVDRPPAEIVLDVRAVACDAVNHRYCTPLRGRYVLTPTPGSGPGAAPELQTATARLPMQRPK